MDAVILAAGLGTRLRPHTLTTPKPLLPVQGRPILDWIIAALPPAVDRLVVVTHYLAGQIAGYLKGQRHVREWATVNQEKPRGTGDALMACRGVVRGDRFFVLNGDDLYGAADLATLAEKPAGLLGRPVDEPRQFGVIFPRKDGSGILERLVEKPDIDGPQLANIGAYLFPRRAADFELPLSPRGEYEITDAVSMVAADEPVHVVPATFWLPIGTVEAWEKAQTADLSAATRGPAR
jgi:bifunctional UDP-N-acetylglucosamine pyrophosphorylase/glucosamine-1-phosphate N-acetyltransferase